MFALLWLAGTTATTLVSDRNMRIACAVNAGHAAALRLHGGATQPAHTLMVDRKQRISRAVSAGQAVALRLRGGGAIVQPVKPKALDLTASASSASLEP